MVDQGGGEAQAQNIPAAGEDGPHDFLKISHADGGGGGGFSGADAAVEVREGDVPAVQPVAVSFAAHLQTQRHDLNFQFPGQIRREITAAVGNDDIVPHKSIALLFFFASMGRFVCPFFPQQGDIAGCWQGRRRS